MASPVPIDASALSPTQYSTFLDISKSMGIPVMTIARDTQKITLRREMAVNQRLRPQSVL